MVYALCCDFSVELKNMDSGGGYTVEVTGLSPNATEKDVHDFFSFSGAIQHVEIIRQVFIIMCLM